MDFYELCKTRRSVRKYDDVAIPQEKIDAIKEEAQKINERSGLELKVVYEEPKAFGGFFKGARSYIVVAGPKNDKLLSEKCGYFGEMLVMKAHELGVSSCWAAATVKKQKDTFAVKDGNKFVITIALGMAEIKENTRKSKSFDAVAVYDEITPWFERGVKCALLAPTALNQQKFKIIKSGNKIDIKAGFGLYTKVDAGIVAYHFECGAELPYFSLLKEK